ncbi:integrase core domain protein [Mycobacterium avium MAV_120809_2495]|nr:integrase core domain protein [Mycobacterium avium MAV_120809_2495]
MTKVPKPLPPQPLSRHSGYHRATRGHATALTHSTGRDLRSRSPVIGTVGDSFDNALAETVNGYYKAELIYGPARSRPWKTVEDVELATLSWVHWHNTSRLHSYLGDIPPTEFEAAFYDAYRTDQPLIGIQ